MALAVKKQCPICRTNNIMSDIILNISTSKINSIVKFLDEIIKQNDSRIILYVRNNILSKNIYKTLENLYEKNMSITICTGIRQIKMKLIEDFNKSNEKTSKIIIVPSKDYDLGQYITGLTHVIITDQNYRYVTNKITMGADFCNNKSKINLSIFEYHL